MCGNTDLLSVKRVMGEAVCACVCVHAPSCSGMATALFTGTGIKEGQRQYTQLMIAWLLTHGQGSIVEAIVRVY